MKLSLLKKSFIHPKTKKELEEQFPCNYDSQRYIGSGEVMTRFLRIDVNISKSIIDFLNWCDVNIDITQDFIAKIVNEQTNVREFIEHYNKIDELFSKKTSRALKSSNEVVKEEINLKRFKNGGVGSLINYANNKINNVRLEYKIALPLHNTLLPKRNTGNKIDITHELQNFDILTTYICNDIFSLVWVEVINLMISQKLITTCYCGTLLVKTGSRKVCIFCGESPTRMKSEKQKKIFPQEWYKKSFKDKIRKYIKNYPNNKTIIQNYLSKNLMQLEEIADMPKLKEELEVFLQKLIDMYK